MLLGGTHTCSMGSVTGTQWPKEGPCLEMVWTQQGDYWQKDNATFQGPAEGGSQWPCKRAEATGPAKGLKTKALTHGHTHGEGIHEGKKGVWCCRLLLLSGAWQMQWCLQHVLNLNPFAAVMLNPSSFKTSPLGRLVLQKGYL